MPVTMTEPILFGGVDLRSVSGLTITGTSTYRYPQRKVKNYDLAFTDNSTTTSAFYGSRSINISCVIVRSAREYLDESIDDLRYILENKNQTLRLPIRNSTFNFERVTVQNIAISDVGGGFAQIDIEFIAGDPHSYALTTTEVLNVVNLTSGNKSYPVTFVGTGKQAPKFTYTVDSFTSGTSKAITFTNPATLQTITVDRTWTVADVLVVDCLLHTVTVNGVAEEFTGNFPQWKKGAGHINYTDEFTARQVDINVIYTKRYL